MDDTRCPVCDRRNPDYDREPVHFGCRVWLQTRLEEMPRRLAQLTLNLVPASVPADDRVSTTRTGSPTGARLDVLSLTGPGSAHISDEAYAGMLQTKIRRWRTMEPGVVTWIDVTAAERPNPEHPDRPYRRFPHAQTRTEERLVPVWHAEVDCDDHGDPYTLLADDQVGSLPIAEWAGEWATMWQQHFGRPRPTPNPFVSRARGNGKTSAAARAQLQLHLFRTAYGPELLSKWWAVGTAWRAWRANAVLHLDTHHTHDPLAGEWQARFGDSVAVPATSPIRYLLAHLAQACDAPDTAALADFAAELRTADAEIGRALGDRVEHVWIGRCPATITNVATGVARPCGAHLWHSPYKGTQYNGAREPVGMRIQCPRCRTAWGPEQVALLALAQQIREVWPVDRTRRYTTAEVNAIRPLSCPGCGGRVRVAWRDVTASYELQRWWRPTAASCPNSCPDARKVI